MLSLVPKWTNIHIRNDNSGSLAHVINSGTTNNVKHVNLLHHAMCFVQKINDVTSHELHRKCQHVLEHGKGKKARQRLDEAMESLRDMSKIAFLQQ